MNQVRLWKQREVRAKSVKNSATNGRIYVPAVLAVAGDLHPLCKTGRKFCGKIQRDEHHFTFSRSSNASQIRGIRDRNWISSTCTKGVKRRIERRKDPEERSFQLPRLYIMHRRSDVTRRIANQNRTVTSA